MDVLLTVVGFIVTLSLLIFIHELGHFLVAKMFGVHVEVFSVGFVGSVFSFQWKETRYQLGWVPLGGYVRMLGEHGGRVPPSMQKVSFSHKPLWQRSLVVLAGPLANLLVLPILVFLGLFLSYSQEISTTIGTVVPGRPAAKIGLKAGDRIESVNGTRTRYFRDLVNTIGRSPGKEVTLKVRRGTRLLTFKVTPAVHERRNPLGDLVKHGLIGISPDYRTPEIGISDPNSPAYKAGLRNWDRIVKVGDTPIQRWDQLVEYWKKNPLGPHRYTVKRALRFHSTVLDFKTRGKLLEFTVTPQKEAGTSRCSKALLSTKPSPAPSLCEKRPAGYHGIHSSELFLRGVRKGTPFAKAGLRRGDRILQLDQKVLHLQIDLEMFPPSKNLRYALYYERGGKVYKTTLQLFQVNWTNILNRKSKRYLLGVRFYVRPYEEVKTVPITGRWRYAWNRSVEETFRSAGAMVSIFGKLFSGELGTKELGSPLMIFQITQEAVKRGWEVFLRQLAFISINLGFVNLLPIPVLDGGHLFFFLVEAIIRRPIPQRIKESALLVGLMLLVVLMFIAIRNDILGFLNP
jgi:regulator of sigma E protease